MRTVPIFASNCFSSSFFKILAICNGTNAAKSIFCVVPIKCRRGLLHGGMLIRFISLSMLRMAIILPAMYSKGIHSNAVSPFFRFRVSQVMRADASILAFSTIIFFGLPVLPDVCIVKVG